MTERELRFDRVEIRYTENTVGLSDLEAVVDELAVDFVDVHIVRRWAGPMATPLFGDVAVAFIIGASAGGFLGELGKDAYKGLKRSIYRLYQRAKTWANDRGYAPLAIEVTSDGQPEVVIHLSLPAGLNAKEFEAAIDSISEALQGIDEDARLLGLSYDTAKGWRVSVVA